MNIIDFTKIMKVLTNSYLKDFDEDIIKVWYEQFKNANKNIFSKSINELIKKNKFMPTIAEIIDEYKKQYKNELLSKIENMRTQNYFKENSEYDKAVMWIENNNIPHWFKDDINNFKNMKLLEEE